MPSIVFLLAGIAGAGYLIVDAANTRNQYVLARDVQRAALPLIISLQEERRLTLRRLASFGTFQSDLIKTREETDSLVRAAQVSLDELAGSAPASVTRAVDRFTELMTQLPTMRTRVDNGKVAISESSALYNWIIDEFIDATKGFAQIAPDAEIAYEQLVIAPMLTGAELMQRSDALAVAHVVGGGLSSSDFISYQGQVSAYHQELHSTIPLADSAVREQYQRLVYSDAYVRLVAVEQALLRGGKELPVSEELWRNAASDVSGALMTMLTEQTRLTNDRAIEKVDTTLTRTIIAGVLVLVLVAGVFVFALRLSRRLIDRLTRLRQETLDVAQNRLPELVERVRSGSDVNVDHEVRLLDYGTDEIGEVAAAFNQAQHTAVAAAVQEAKTREGTNTVFLNIAHRSQVIVHRQLKALDEAERQQEDPELLSMLFQLDHLATRSRRNAENLIILGGGQPGRRWRNPVSLAELVRGAAAETEHFARVKMAKLPALSVTGHVVGDLVHLLAELLDNATAFSRPDARVDVRGNVVGRGVVLEIEDQGLGIEPDRAAELNEMLTNPPDFGIMALSAEPRLGLFVVARLAARHGISVALRESAYGGTRAIVFVRAELLGNADQPDAVQPAPEPRPATNGHVIEPPVTAEPIAVPIAEALAPETPDEISADDSPTVTVIVPPQVSTTVSLPPEFYKPLPPLPFVKSRPGEDLFRPQVPVPDDPDNRPLPPWPRRGEKQVPQAEEPAPPQQSLPSPEPVTPMAPGRPPLPKRRRQQNLAPQLRTDSAATALEPEEPQFREDSPDEARSRLAAFQRGTRQAREEPVAGE